MSRIYLLLILFFACAVVTLGQATVPDAAELTKLLNDFLAGASRNDAAMHDRFWADDLIYTRSAGRRVTKADVMRDARSTPAPRPGDPRTTYTAEDVRIQQYGGTAIVAFRLVGTSDRQGTIQILNFLNTGTFLKRNGKWQVVSWQSTRMPRSEDEAKKEVSQTHSMFFQAILNADVKKLEELTDETFVWMHRTGNQESQKVMLDNLTSGRLKYSKLETTDVVVNISGDTAIVLGSSPRQRVAVTGATNVDINPFTAFYTLVFVNQGGVWKAVAMHTSWV